jgi:iron(III) transport system permease protein
VLLRERTARLVGRSVALAGVVTSLTLVLGIGLAWLTVRTDLPARRALAVVAVLPLAVPTYVAGFVWISLDPGLAGWSGAVLVLVLCTYPYVYLPVAAVLSRIDPAQEEISRALGIGPLATFRRVVLPQLRPAAAGGGLLVALYVLSDFGAVSILRFDTFTRVIYDSYRSSFDRTTAAVLALLLVAVTVLVVAGEARARGRARVARVGSGSARTARLASLGRARIPAVLAVLSVAVLALGVPAATLVYWMTRGTSAVASWSGVGSAAATTLQVSALGALVTLVLALPVGVLAARYRGAVPSLLERSAYLGHALPGIVVALAMVFLAVRYATPFYQRTPVLLLAYAVLFLPLAIGAVRASVSQSAVALEEVARSLGERPISVLRRVTVPLAAPGIAAGAALVFLACVKELPATLLLRPTGTRTLATELWTQTGVGAYAAAAPYAALLVLLAAVPTYLLGRSGGLLEGSGER